MGGDRAHQIVSVLHEPSSERDFLQSEVREQPFEESHNVFLQPSPQMQGSTKDKIELFQEENVVLSEIEANESQEVELGGEKEDTKFELYPAENMLDY